jgi:ubiquinone/menaquinone biosynthesis C-methylase UbiE
MYFYRHLSPARFSYTFINILNKEVMMSRFDQVATEWDSSNRRQIMASDIAKAIKNTKLLHHNMHLLDFGAGTGLLTKHLTPFVTEITALDLSQSMLDQLDSNTHDWGGGKISTVHSDILEYSPNICFDGIVSSMSMHHVEDLDALFQKFYTLLRPNGFIAIADLKSEDGSFHSDGNEGVFHFGFTQKSLNVLLKEHGFKMLMFKTVHTVLKDENSHYPLFLLTALKCQSKV